MEVKNNTTLCVVPARGGSKGIKNKNLKKISGKSLLQITIEEAKNSQLFDTVHVSTESKDIKKEAENYGIDFPFMREAKLAEDNIHVSEVVADVLLSYKKVGINFNNVCLLMPTSPLRTSSHIKEAFNKFMSSDSDFLVSVCELGKLETNLRYFNDSGLLEYFNKDLEKNKSRQNCKQIYTVNGSIFIAKVSSFLDAKTFHGKGVIGYEMDSFHSIDINTYKDLELAEILFSYSRSAQIIKT